MAQEQNMQRILHQFHNEEFYEPSWKIKHLFLGTFNPSGGEKVNYYYGRELNQTWPTLSLIFDCEFKPANTAQFYSLIKEKQIACLDLIDELIVPLNRLDFVLGKGYKDSSIINGIVKRKYNTIRINNIIKNNPGIHIYSTWGKGSNLLEWNAEVSKIDNILKLVSPSLAAKVPKGTKKIPHIIGQWQTKIFP